MRSALLLLSALVVGVSAEGWGLPQCAQDCEGLDRIDWSNDHESCAYFAKKGFGCLDDCADDALTMDGVGVKGLPRQCHWQLLGCAELLFSKNPLADGDSFCPDICENGECLLAYESLISSKRQLDLHRRCATNC
jgi:hypothetical protein